MLVSRLPSTGGNASNSFAGGAGSESGDDFVRTQSGVERHGRCLPLLHRLGLGRRLIATGSR